tara:strand:- start:1070 stop:1693 length:624 start_codon:yes stop_codon:yes gene_type:complete
MSDQKLPDWLTPRKLNSPRPGIEPVRTAQDDFEVIKRPRGRPKVLPGDPPAKSGKDRKPRTKVSDDASLGKLVQMMTACGVAQVKQASILSISLNTLLNNFPSELKHGAISANMQVAQALFSKALEGDVRAQIFWLESKGGFQKVDKLELAVNGADNMSPTEKGQRLASILLENKALMEKFKEGQANQTPAEPVEPGEDISGAITVN